MINHRHVCATLFIVCLALTSMSAQAQVTLQSRGSNITNGPVNCTGQDTTSPIIFNGASALPAAANTFVVGADIVIQTGDVQHVFVGVSGGSITPPPGATSGNGLLVTLAQGEVHKTNLFPLNTNSAGEVAGFRLNTNTPVINVTFSCSAGQFQGQVFLYFIQF